MDILIYALVAVIAVAFIVEAVKRTKNSSAGSERKAAEEASLQYISADESDPTQTGRMKAIKIKNAIQGKEPEVAQIKPAIKGPVAPKERGNTRSISHEKIEALASGEFELPDPFSVDIADESKE